MVDIGPVEYVVIGFPGNRFKGEIVPATAELVDNDIIDVAFITGELAARRGDDTYTVLYESGPALEGGGTHVAVHVARD